METGGGGRLSNGSEDGAGALEDRDADRGEIMLIIGGAGSGGERPWSQMFDDCNFHKFKDTELKMVEGLEGEDIVGLATLF